MIKVLKGIYIVLLFLAIAPSALFSQGAQKSGQASKTSTVSQNTTFLICNAIPFSSYDVTKNGASLTTVPSSGFGVFSFSDISDTGDLYSFLGSGSNPETPSQPGGLTAVGNDQGCAQCGWSPNPEDNITGYRLYFGKTSVNGGGAVAYDDSVDVGKVTSYYLCGLTEGKYYMALRAINWYGLMSGLSAEASADVSTGSAQGPLPPQQVSVSETSPGCVSASWQANTEPDLAGYVVYYGSLSVAGGSSSTYADSVSVGMQTSTTICNFQAGTYYFAVKALNTNGDYSGYSTEKTLAVAGPDYDPPVIDNVFPADNATDVPLNTGISFRISDDNSGVDSTSISVLINGNPATTIKMQGSSASYNVSAWPGQDFAAGTVVSVKVSGGDKAQTANVDSLSWSFTTGNASDTEAPVFCCLSPRSGSTDVERFSDIQVGISDAGSGVDWSSIQLIINNVPADFTSSGDNSDLLIKYDNTIGFQPGSTINIRVVACDLADPPNCSEINDYKLEVSGAQAAPASEVLIVPDGYWATDPTRPLEVRNMPKEWTVRIFSTAGLQVRAFRNTVRDQYNWFWDFTNDYGQKVARALYFVRVTDRDGNVMKKGRFLVQRVP